MKTLDQRNKIIDIAFDLVVCFLLAASQILNNLYLVKCLFRRIQKMQKELQTV